MVKLVSTTRCAGVVDGETDRGCEYDCIVGVRDGELETEAGETEGGVEKVANADGPAGGEVDAVADIDGVTLDVEGVPVEVVEADADGDPEPVGVRVLVGEYVGEVVARKSMERLALGDAAGEGEGCLDPDAVADPLAEAEADVLGTNNGLIVTDADPEGVTLDVGTSVIEDGFEVGDLELVGELADGVTVGE